MTTNTSSSVQEALDLLAKIQKWQADDKQGYDVAIALVCEAEDSLHALVEENQQLREDRAIQDEIQRTVSAEMLEAEQRAEALQAELAEARADAGELEAIKALVSDRGEVGTYAKVENLEQERDTLLARLEGLQDAVGTFTAFFRERHYGRMPSEVEEGLNQLDALRGKE